MNHKDLIVWQKSIALVSHIYKQTNAYPQSELFGLTSQMRRSAISIPSNIAEGCGRNSGKELAQFLNIALGSASELETQVIISCNLGFLQKENIRETLNLLNEIIRMISALIKSLKTRATNN